MATVRVPVLTLNGRDCLLCADGDKWYLVNPLGDGPIVDLNGLRIEGFSGDELSLLVVRGWLNLWTDEEGILEPSVTPSELRPVVLSLAYQMKNVTFPDPGPGVSEEELMALMGSKEDYMREDPVPVWDN